MLSRLRPKYVWVFDGTTETDEATGAELVKSWGGKLRQGRVVATWARRPSRWHRRTEAQASLEWNFWTDIGRVLGAGASIQASTDDYDWTVSLRAHRLGSVFLSVGGILPPWPTTQHSPYEERSLDFNFGDGTLHWRVWADPNCWTAGTPRWRDGHFNIVDWLLGKAVYEVTDLAVHDDVPVPLPEGQYLITVTMKRATWRRPRTILGIGERDIIRADCDFAVPIPSGPKGPSSSMSFPLPAADLWRAVAGVQEAILHGRNRGGARGDRLLPR